MTTVCDTTFDQERALYGSDGIRLVRCAFDGPADGESALKESSDITAEQCRFNLRYPFWHDHGLRVFDSELTPNCRAAFWYSDHIEVRGSKLHGIKALRECTDVGLYGCSIVSPEFGWSTSRLRVEDTDAEGEYFLLRASDLEFSQLRLKGKYSFQYVENAVFSDCTLDTKDAFWHAKNVTVRDSVVRGEYLGWYSDGLTLINCKISGTQPFCYCKHLRLVQCELNDADLCFEKSEVDATITTPVVSIKNPAYGRIVLPSVGTVIQDDPASRAEIVLACPRCAAC